MAIPNTITGLSNQVPVLGPFKVTAGKGAVLTSIIPGGLTGGGVFGTTGAQQRSQSFTMPAGGGKVWSFETQISKFNSPTDFLTADIYATDGAGTPTGSAIATSITLIDGATVDAGTTGGSYEFVFNPPVTLTASTQYAAVVRRTGALNDTDAYRSKNSGANVDSAQYQNTFNGTVWGTPQAIDNRLIVNAGNAEGYYLIGRDAATSTEIDVLKTADPSTTWTNVASNTTLASNGLSNGANWSAVQVGSVIHILAFNGPVPSGCSVNYIQFDAATDTFGTVETVYGTQAITGQLGAVHGVSLVVRSNGEAVALFNGLQTKTSGTFRARMYYSRRTAVNTWSAAVQVDTNAATDNCAPLAVLGAADAVHLLWSTGTTRSQRTLSAANALQTASTPLASAGNATVNYTQSAVSYLVGGVTKVVTTSIYTSNASVIVKFDSANTPALSLASLPSSQPFGSSNRYVSLFADLDVAGGTIVTAIMQGASDFDLYISRSSDHGASWWPPFLFTSVSLGPIYDTNAYFAPIYTRGSDVIAPFMYYDNSVLKYHEYVVRHTDLLEQTTQNGTLPFARAGAGLVQQFAQGFVVPAGVQWAIKGVVFPIAKVGSPTDACGFEIRKDSLTGTVVALSGGFSGSSLYTTPTWCSFVGLSASLTGGTYYLILKRNSTLSDTNYYTTQGSSANPYSGGEMYAYKDGSWQSAGLSGYDLQFQIGGEVQAPSITNAWNANDKTNITLSNGDKTATVSATTCGVHSTQTRTANVAGKYYAELKADSYSNGILGLQLVTTDETNGGGTGGFYVSYAGNIWDGVQVKGNVGSAIATGDVICMAWDALAKLIWFRKNNGLWNNSATANPATGTEGITCYSSSSAALWFGSGGVGSSTTVRTEAADLTEGNYPSGFTSWMGETLVIPEMGTLVSGVATVAASGVSSVTGTGALVAVNTTGQRGAGLSTSLNTAQALVAQGSTGQRGSGAATWNATGALVAGVADLDAVGQAVAAPVTGTGALTSVATLAGVGVVTNYTWTRPGSDVATDGWTDQAGGASNIYTTLDEPYAANDSDYVKSPTGAGDLVVRLFDGSTQIATWSHVNPPDTFTTAEQTLTTPQYEAISDFSNLFVEFDDSQSNVYRFKLGATTFADPPVTLRYRYKKTA